MPKPFSQTKVAQALLEIAEDRIADAIRHMKDVTTLEGKPSEVTIKIAVTPNAARDQFSLSVAGGVKLSGRYSAQSTLFADMNGDEVEFSEFNPQQRSMLMD